MSTPLRVTSRVVDGLVYNPLEMPGRPIHMELYTIKGGQTLKRGSVLGKITASGLLVLSLSAAADGSQTPFAVLREDVSSYDIDGTTALDTPMPVIRQGTLNPEALVLGTAHTVATVKAGFASAAQGIDLRAPGYSG